MQQITQTFRQMATPLYGNLQLAFLFSDKAETIFICCFIHSNYSKYCEGQVSYFFLFMLFGCTPKKVFSNIVTQYYNNKDTQYNNLKQY